MFWDSFGIDIGMLMMLGVGLVWHSFTIYLAVSKKIGAPQNGWLKIMENPIKMDDLFFSPYFWKHPFGCHFCDLFYLRV